MTTPYPDRPFEGVFTITTELSPMASPAFEVNRPTETEVLLSNDDRTTLAYTVKTIATLVQSETCPARINSKICKRCAYYDFCYIED